MRAYSEDLRIRIVQCVVSGTSPREAAELFSVSERSVVRYLQQQREEGHLRPKPHPGRPPKMTPEQVTALARQLHEHPGLTLEERSELLEVEENVELSVSSMQRWVRKLRYSRKKAVSARSNGTKRIAGRS